MGIIREPLDVDFVVDPRPLSKEDQQKISDFIKADKLSCNPLSGEVFIFITISQFIFILQMDEVFQKSSIL